ncbi:hypothetical protein LX36DRAFT_149324 [Colletotrichum falcatum]|nr:hypothetical protein LX36DRAFT_149324 [Colletotrichum falcatum]
MYLSTFFPSAFLARHHLERSIHVIRIPHPGSHSPPPFVIRLPNTRYVVGVLLLLLGIHHHQLKPTLHCERHSIIHSHVVFYTHVGLYTDQIICRLRLVHSVRCPSRHVGTPLLPESRLPYQGTPIFRHCHADRCTTSLVRPGCQLQLHLSRSGSSSSSSSSPRSWSLSTNNKNSNQQQQPTV